MRFLFLLLVYTTAFAQVPDWLVGTWRGTATGKPGDGKVERICTRVLGGKFIECRHTAVYAKETHTDIGYVSFDKRAKKLRLRQFHVEGFVNTYAETEPLVFVSESIENIPDGWRAREEWRRTDDGGWEETFSLAAPGKEFEVYSKTVMKKEASRE